MLQKKFRDLKNYCVFPHAKLGEGDEPVQTKMGSIFCDFVR